MSKARAFFGNGNVRMLLQAGALVFAAGVVWAKVAGVEAQVAALTTRVDMLIRTLLP